MNTLKFIVVVSMVLLATDLVYHQVVNGQVDESIEAIINRTQECLDNLEKCEQKQQQRVQQETNQTKRDLMESANNAIDKYVNDTVESNNRIIEYNNCFMGLANKSTAYEQCTNIFKGIE